MKWLATHPFGDIEEIYELYEKLFPHINWRGLHVSADGAWIHFHQ